MTVLVPNCMRSIVASLIVTFVVIASSPSIHAQGCDADANGDGNVDGADLALVLTNWGECNATPAIHAVYPSSGPSFGGTPVAIVGSQLSSTKSVVIDGRDIAQFAVVSSTTVVVVTPPGAPGLRDVVLRNQQLAPIASASFTYEATPLRWATVIEVAPDPAVVYDPELRNQLISTGLPWRVRDNATQIEMVLIPPGTFSMGCSGTVLYPCDHPEEPVHPVSITSPFYIGRFETTKNQWDSIMRSSPPATCHNASGSGTNCPVNVSWQSIQGFLTQTELRLPTEAEWEYSCRAGTATALHGTARNPNGSNDDEFRGEIAWFYDNTYGDATPGARSIGQKPSNGFGLHDSLGNVSEWVSDWFGPYRSGTQLNPQGPVTGSFRVYRGGGWASNGFEPRTSYRGYGAPTYAEASLGFRVARNP
jgi:formylglycine-generating enzyme required for sulfatase activity